MYEMLPESPSGMNFIANKDTRECMVLDSQQQSCTPTQLVPTKTTSFTSKRLFAGIGREIYGFNLE